MPDLSKLRWLVPTGEALPPELVTWWLDRFPNVPMLNAYGPTECSDDVTHHRISSKPSRGAARVPIGTPVANTALYILDHRMRLVPSGVPGELFVGGVCVGRGYVDDPRRTAESYVPDPFGEDAGARLYRTGDLAQYLPDGSIDFLGRLDQQVKIRGFRIELGEIEAALSQLSDIDSCVVTTHDTIRADKQLVAYFTHTGAEPSVGSLREHLAAQLPDYMVPQFFIPLSALPLTPNGKLDRNALPPPYSQPSVPIATFVPPQTAVEERIALSWQQILSVDRVGRRDNFFDLGGHSLLMLRVFELLSRHYPDLALVDLFHYPTVEHLARFISSDDEYTSGPTGAERARTRREGTHRQRERRHRTRTGH
jgi:hypothetical protein